ncbi:transglutaminase-like domain-containing protein [Methylomonas koyamae]|nr:transglutaminase-like domain-containing protein [Methylomonas koyamae]
MESGHQAIKAAAKLSTDALLQTTRKTYDWVVANVRDSGYLREERGALYALENQQGDCTESAYLFTALARANAIPARAVAGYVLENNGLLRAAEYHEWSEFYDDGTWRIADPQKRSYDQNYDHYVAMRLVDNRPDAVFKFARYRYSGNGLEVEME